MVRTSPSPFSFAFPSIRLDGPRILSVSCVIAVHVLAALLLLLPLSRPSLPIAPPDTIEPRWTVERVLPVTPLPPTEIAPKVQPPRLQPVAVPVPPRIAPSMPVVVDGGSLPATPGVDTATPVDTSPGPVGAPLAGAQLRYAVAPPPPYPRDALRAGIEGTVLLRVLVDVDGRPLDVQVERSSGNRSLDREAVRHVQQRWRFEPAQQDGRAVQAYGLVPIGFNLQ